MTRLEFIKEILDTCAFYYNVENGCSDNCTLQGTTGCFFSLGKDHLDYINIEPQLKTMPYFKETQK